MNDKSTMNKIMEYMALGKPIVQFDLTEGRFSAQEASLYARRNDADRPRARRSSRCSTIAERRARMGDVGPRARASTSSRGSTRRRELLAAYEELFKCATSR